MTYVSLEIFSQCQVRVCALLQSLPDRLQPPPPIQPEQTEFLKNILIVQWSICVQEIEHMYMYYKKYTSLFTHIQDPGESKYMYFVKFIWSYTMCWTLGQQYTVMQSCCNVSHRSGRSKNAPKQVILQTCTIAHITFWEEQKHAVHVMIQTLTKCEGSPQLLQQW